MINLGSKFDSDYKKLEEFAGVLFIILSGFMMTAVFKLNNFFTFPNLDEMLWHFRSRFFWDKMLNFDFSGLIQSAQPGITVYWFTGFMMKFINFDFTTIPRLIAEKGKQGLDFNSVVNANDSATYKLYESISFAFNAPLFLLMIVFFITFYYLLKKLGFNRVIATFSLLFLTTDVYLIYWNTPSDKMLNIFITLSFLTFLVYLEKKDKKRYLVFSAILGSWAVLSKLSALLILPLYFLLFIFYSLPLDRKKIKDILKDYFLWILVFSFVSVVFLPTIVVRPTEVYNLVFRPENVFEGDYRANSYFSRLLFDYAKYFVFGVLAYVAQGFVLSLLAYVFLRFNKKRREIFNSLPSKHVKAMIVYVFSFFAMVTTMSMNHDVRFMSPAIIILSVIGAIGLYGAVETLFKNAKLDLRMKSPLYVMTAVVIIISQMAFIFFSGTLIGKIFK